MGPMGSFLQPQHRAYKGLRCGGLGSRVQRTGSGFLFRGSGLRVQALCSDGVSLSALPVRRTRLRRCFFFLCSILCWVRFRLFLV